LLKAFLPTETITALREFEKTEFYDNLREEHLFNVEYRKGVTPRPPKTFGPSDPGLKYETIFQTVDAIVVQTGHVLLIKRKSRPGKGLWALPGGFVNAKERLIDAVIRELREETRIKVPEAVLRGSIVYKDDFDYPDRSLRGRTISKAFLIKLPDHVVDGKISLPKVKGDDDAEKAWWVPIDEIMRSPEMFFEDHWFGIEYMLGKL
jgi:bifunctional NMN adenylyltransferase/nudix hydrolase